MNLLKIACAAGVVVAACQPSFASNDITGFMPEGFYTESPADCAAIKAGAVEEHDFTIVSAGNVYMWADECRILDLSVDGNVASGNWECASEGDVHVDRFEIRKSGGGYVFGDGSDEFQTVSFCEKDWRTHFPYIMTEGAAHAGEGVEALAEIAAMGEFMCEARLTARSEAFMSGDGETYQGTGDMVDPTEIMVYAPQQSAEMAETDRGMKHLVFAYRESSYDLSDVELDLDSCRPW